MCGCLHLGRVEFWGLPEKGGRKKVNDWHVVMRMEHLLLNCILVNAVGVGNKAGWGLKQDRFGVFLLVAGARVPALKFLGLLMSALLNSSRGRRTRVVLLLHSGCRLLRPFGWLLPRLVALFLFPFLVDLLLLDELFLRLMRPFLPFVPDALQVTVDLLEPGGLLTSGILILQLLGDDIEGRVFILVLRV